MNKILENKAKCLVCDNVITSVHRHDFSCCACGNVCVDGGKDYIRRVFRDGPASFEELSVYEKEQDHDDYDMVNRHDNGYHDE